MYIYRFETFTTPCELHLEAATQIAADDAANLVIEQAYRLEQRYSYFTQDSELYRVNHRISNEVSVDEEFSVLMQLALFYHQLTSGAFDVCLAGTSKELCTTSLQEYKNTFEKLSVFASCSNVALHMNTLVFSNDITKIDFGGLVKEYAVDQSVLLLKQQGIESGLVNFGGDIATFGDYFGEDWSIGIQDPKDASKNMQIVALRECSLCTSGHSKRFQEIEGERLSHIISQKKNDIQQISIIAPTTVDAGVWSTALLVDPTLVPPPHIQVVSKVCK